MSAEEDKRRLEVVREIQKNITFFQDNWAKFCKLAEEYGKHLDTCRNDPACEYQQGRAGLVAEYEALKKSPDAAKKAGDSQATKKLQRQINRLQQKINNLPESQRPGPGYTKFEVCTLEYYNLPYYKGHSSNSIPLWWIRPGPIDPTDWLLCDCAQDISQEHRLIADCALLSIMHDTEPTLSGIDARVYSTAYSGNYFRRDEFCHNVRSKVLDEAGSIDRIERALERVRHEIGQELTPNNGDTWQIPWDDEDKDYILASEAIVKFTDGKMPQPTLSKKLKQTRGIPVHHMRKGQRCKVHMGDFREYVQKLYPPDDAAAEIAGEYLANIETRKELEKNKGKRQ